MIGASKLRSQATHSGVPTVIVRDTSEVEEKYRKYLDKVFSLAELEALQFAINSAMNTSAELDDASTALLQTLDQLQLDTSRDLITERMICNVPSYTSAIKVIEAQSDSQTVLLCLTRRRILMAIGQVHNLIFGRCLPRARQIVKLHTQCIRSGDPTSCHCASYGEYKNEHWVNRIILALMLKLDTRVDFILDSSTYLPSIQPSRTFQYTRPLNNRQIQVTENQVVTNFKAILQMWLDISQDHCDSHRGLLTNLLHDKLGPHILLLKSVWELCMKMPSWFFDNFKTTSDLADGLSALFLKSLDGTQVLTAGTLEQKTLHHIGTTIFQCLTTIRHLPQKHSQDQQLASSTANNFVANCNKLPSLVKFMRIALQAAQNNGLPSNHPAYKKYCTPYAFDHYSPLREVAPSRKNITRVGGPCDPTKIHQPQSLFSLLVFRVLTFATVTAQQHDHHFTLSSLKELMDDPHTPMKNWFICEAYGTPNINRKQRDIYNTLWKSAHDKWPKFVKDTPKSALECIRFFTNGQAWPQIGALMRILLLGDLILAGVVKMPGVEEMGNMIYRLDKGAVAGLSVLGLCPEKPSKEQVVTAFSQAHHSILESFSDAEREEMHFDILTLEHALYAFLF
ncbi:hypothetical protein K474DRAFT_1680931 [Panus rudis PR-1116 ss-1]|nr:hypothetical protein K474DRAFT_1680931 [Panus rudis PR-1116 ss-1]